MAATVKQNIAFHASTDGVAPEIRFNQKIAASQGILIPGAPLYLSQSGTWKVSDTSDGTGDTYHGLFVGLQNADSTWPLAAELAANTKIRVFIIRSTHLYKVYVEDNDTDAAAAQAIVGNEYGLRVATGASKVGYITMDVNNANAAVHVEQVMGNVEPEKFDLTTAPGVAIVRFLPAVIDVTRA